MTYQVRHRTQYDYELPVSTSYGELHLLPRDVPSQRCVSAVVAIEPAPQDYRERTDYFGNRVAHYAVHTTHQRLVVTTTSLIDIDLSNVATLASCAGLTWHDAVLTDAHTLEASLDARQFVLPSPSVPITGQVREFAAPIFTPGRDLADTLTALLATIHDGFTFQPGATTVTTTIDEVIEQRAGVCQDFAHLAIGLLRSQGIAARYVSGYLETLPPPGQPRLVGADVSHAWVSVFVPQLGWIDIDPTNNQAMNERYVIIGWGRDYTDVPPLKGVIYTEGAQHELEVSVDVVSIPPVTGQN